MGEYQAWMGTKHGQRRHCRQNDTRRTVNLERTATRIRQNALHMSDLYVYVTHLYVTHLYVAVLTLRYGMVRYRPSHLYVTLPSHLYITVRYVTVTAQATLIN